MARHEIVIHENTGATKESAPYLGSYIAKETVAMAAFAEAVGAKCGMRTTDAAAGGLEARPPFAFVDPSALLGRVWVGFG